MNSAAASIRHIKVLVLGVFVTALTLVSAVAQIAITGLTDKTVYTDRVTFTVPTQAGYDFDVRLDAQPIPVGVATTVDKVDYHELSVWRTNQTTGDFTNQVVRFIVASSERRGAENGLRPWNPYPMIPSTAEEVAGAHVRLITPQAYPAGMEIPVIAWIENESGGPVRANGSLKAPGHPSITIRRGVGSGFLEATNTPGALTYSPTFIGRPSSRTIQLEQNPTWTSVSGTLSGNTEWPENSRIALTGSLTLPADSTLTIGPGTIVRVG
ncbi:MAG TPA: hypothetical protein VEC99_16045, partial [Clostridia bacterium]|nr:hypothetical protein [Clostridia bacterium]